MKDLFKIAQNLHETKKDIALDLYQTCQRINQSCYKAIIWNKFAKTKLKDQLHQDIVNNWYDLFRVSENLRKAGFLNESAAISFKQAFPRPTQSNQEDEFRDEAYTVINELIATLGKIHTNLAKSNALQQNQAKTKTQIKTTQQNTEKIIYPQPPVTTPATGTTDPGAMQQINLAIRFASNQLQNILSKIGEVQSNPAYFLSLRVKEVLDETQISNQLDETSDNLLSLVNTIRDKEQIAAEQHRQAVALWQYQNITRKQQPFYQRDPNTVPRMERAIDWIGEGRQRGKRPDRPVIRTDRPTMRKPRSY